jgi:tetratricopeptide (TPR) repeat protein
MKSERRHELQHNELADALETVGERLKPYLRVVGGIAVVGLVAILISTYVSAQSAKRNAAGWDEYFEALNGGDRERLAQLAEKYAGTPVAPWARVTAADIGLGEGCTRLFRERSLAKEALQQAASNYQTVLEETSEATLRQRALFGLARSYEALDQLPKARETYRKLIDSFPEGIYIVAAKSRLSDIDRESTKQFYDWFAKYEPPAAASPSGKRPDFLEDTLDKMDLNLPSSLTEPLIKEGDTSGVGLDELDLPDSPANETEPSTEEEMDEVELDEAAPAEPSDAPATEQSIDETPAKDDESPAAQDSP